MPLPVSPNPISILDFIHDFSYYPTENFYAETFTASGSELKPVLLSSGNWWIYVQVQGFDLFAPKHEVGQVIFYLNFVWNVNLPPAFANKNWGIIKESQLISTNNTSTLRRLTVTWLNIQSSIRNDFPTVPSAGYPMRWSRRRASEYRFNQLYAGDQASGSLVSSTTVGFPNGVQTSIPSSGTISLGNFHGAIPKYELNITGAVGSREVRSLAINIGWDSNSELVVTVLPGAVVDVTDRSAAMVITGAYFGGITLINYGTIRGAPGLAAIYYSNMLQTLNIVNYGSISGNGGSFLFLSSGSGYSYTAAGPNASVSGSVVFVN
jgi:hypothetical protein